MQTASPARFCAGSLALMMGLPHATRPTMYFIGVTTGQSSIRTIFPEWARRLQLGDCELRGLDLPLHAPAAAYRAIVDAVRRDPLVRGALVTTHKVDLHHACRDQFDWIDPLSDSLGEVSSIYKRDGRLLGRSVDPWTVGEALAAFLPVAEREALSDVLILGAGGAGTALAWYLTQAPGGHRARRIVAADRRPERLAHLQRLRSTWADAHRLETVQVATAEQSDDLLRALPARSLVVNATGAGKDTPGSPLTDAAIFPERGWAWDYNYRGELRFLQQARAQQVARGLQVQDGWVYFLHGWMRVIGDVFAREIPTRGAQFEELADVARAGR